jgi:hypothetical protein
MALKGTNKEFATSIAFELSDKLSKCKITQLKPYKTFATLAGRSHHKTMTGKWRETTCRKLNHDGQQSQES